MATEIKSMDPCPTCLLQNQVVNTLIDRPGSFFTTCKAGHKFEDTEELNNLRKQARSKYPQFYKGPESPKPMDPSVMAGMDILINAEVKHAMEEIVGQQITSGSDIKGFLFAYVEDNKDKDNELKSLRATLNMLRRRTPAAGGKPTGLADNQIIIDLPEWAIEGGIAQQAEHAGMSMEDWVNQEIAGYFENYFSKAPAR